MTADAPTSPVLSVRKLTVDYAPARRPTVRAVHGVDLEVRRGEVVALVGQSGSGKSSLVSAVLGLLPPRAVTGGDVEIAGRSWRELGQRERAAQRGSVVGYVPQDPGLSLNPSKTVGSQVADALRHRRRLPRSTIDATVLERLRDAGLRDAPTLVSRYPHELSGGMRQRVLIAIALANRPQLLLADEPTSALDVTVQRGILDRLDLLRREFDLGVLLVTHDLAVAAERADRVLVMHDGHIVESGSTERVISSPLVAYTRELVATAPELDESVQPRPPLVPDERPVVLSLRDVSKSYPAGRAQPRTDAVSGADLTVRAGTIHAVVGESGAGKSTLARIAVGLTAPTSGEVRLGADRVDTQAPARLRDLRTRLQFVHQNPAGSLDPRMRIGDIVTEPLRVHGRLGRRTSRDQRAHELLNSVGLDASLAHRRPGELSGGQLQRVAIARGLALEPKVIVLDEPVSALDVIVQSAVLRLLTHLRDEQGIAFVLVTHDLSVVRRVADDVTVMQHGRVVESATAHDVFSAPSAAYTRELLASSPRARKRANQEEKRPGR